MPGQAEKSMTAEYKLQKCGSMGCWGEDLHTDDIMQEFWANSPYYASNYPEKYTGIHWSCISKQSHISDDKGFPRQDGCQEK